MSDESVVVRATLGDLATVQEIRFRALEDAPYAFGSTLPRERGLSDAEWRSRFDNGPWFVAYRGQRTVGVVAAFVEGDDRHLVSMWVEPAERGTGTATALARSVVKWAESEGARGVILWVADGNSRARRFYERLGFATTGRRQPLPSNPESGEEQFRLNLRAGPSATM